MEKHSALYTDLPDLRTIRARIEARRDYDAMKATGNLLDDSEAPPPLDFSDIQKEVRRANTEDRQSRRHALLEQRAASVAHADRGRLVRDGRLPCERPLQDAFKPTSRISVAQRSTRRACASVTRATLRSRPKSSRRSSKIFRSRACVVIFLVAGVIVLYYRWWKQHRHFGGAATCSRPFTRSRSRRLPPLSIDSLNSNTAFLGSIIVGNGINFGIVLLARYVEERRKKVSVEKSLVLGINGARIGTLSAALAAGVSYASLVITQFRGFRQFGCIGGIGMVLSWCAAFFLMPPLVAFLDRDDQERIQDRTEAQTRVVVSDHGRSLESRDEVFRASWSRSEPRSRSLAIGIAHSFDMSHLEYDFSKLRRADTWTNGEGFWGRRMDELLGTYLTPVVLLADDHDQATAIEAHVRDAIAKPPMQQMVANVRTIDDVLPSDQQAKLDEAGGHPRRFDAKNTVNSSILTTNAKRSSGSSTNRKTKPSPSTISRAVF